MSILTANNLNKTFGDDEIFDGINVTVSPGAKIALVGSNGAGKTTLLRILIGLDSPSAGTVHLAKNISVGYLPQNPALDGKQTLYQEMLSAFESLQMQEAELRKLESQLDSGDEDLLERYGRMQLAFDHAGGYAYELEIEQVLQGLGFTSEQYEHPLHLLSGGQKTRALLARLLLEKPDLLVLDEPTNHLDIAAIEWLESYLNNFEGAVLMVSHDRYFMDKVVSVIWEMEWGDIELYRGNYSHYLQQREERYERRLKEYETQQAYIAKEQDYIRKHIASQNTAQAKGKRRRLERLMSGTDRHNRAVDNPWFKKKPARRKQVHIRLQASSRTGDQVLKTKSLTVGYESDKPLFTAPDLLLLRGEVAAIIGPNGAGKSTFLKTILEDIPPLDGSATWGAQVDIGYFAQAHEDLDPKKTVMDEILAIKNLPISETRNYLALYLFTGDDVYRPVSTLSGGERGRLALAKLALAGANVLLLDEPTNHLDIPSQEILQDVLAHFKGTILLVSHDRYIIDALASQIWHITPGNMHIFEGSYAQYMDTRKQESTVVAESKNGNTQAKSVEAPEASRENKHGLNPYQRQKRIEELESLIHGLETDIDQITRELESASAIGAVDEVSALGEAYTTKEHQLNEALEEWTDLAE